jgi:hypothetical protein
VLVPGLAVPHPAAQRQAVKRWVALAALLQALVVAAVVAYALARSRLGDGGLAWVAPPLAALIGTALPLQLAAFRILRTLSG